MEFNKGNILNKVKAATQTTVVMDEGLRAYMLKVYNCLLYTSPSPRDGLLSRMPSSA